MVGKLLNFLYRESGSLNQTALLLGSFAFLGQIFGFLRDRLLAHVFGAGTDLDIYYAAFRVPDFLFVTVASVVSISVLVPFIVERDFEDAKEEGGGRKNLHTFIDSVFSFFVLLMLGAALLAYIFMPQLSRMLFEGFSPEALERVVSLSRLLLLSPILLGFSNLLGSLTQAYNRFMTYALSPVLYNAGIVLGIVFLGERFGINGVAFGVIAGALMHAAIQVPFIVKEGLWPKVLSKPDWVLVKKVMKISVPRTLTLSTSSLALIALVSFASYMAQGSISVLSFATNLQGVPLSLIGVSYSLAAFPVLTRRFQEKNLEAFMEQMQITSRFIIFWTLPLTALLVILRAQIVRVILGTGLFDWGATRLTAAALALFAVSALFQSLMLLITRGFYSAGKTQRPFYINLFSTIFLLGVTYGLIQWFEASESFRYFITALMKVDDVPGAAVLMLPLGFSIGMIVNCLIHWIDFEREFKGYTKGVSQSLFDSFGASVIMGAAAYFMLNVFSASFDTATLVGVFLQGLAAGLVAIVVGVLVFVALKNREIASVWAALKGKFRPGKVIATDPEIV